jgi:hypothetical protein
MAEIKKKLSSSADGRVQYESLLFLAPDMPAPKKFMAGTVPGHDDPFQLVRKRLTLLLVVRL